MLKSDKYVCLTVITLILLIIFFLYSTTAMSLLYITEKYKGSTNQLLEDLSLKKKSLEDYYIEKIKEQRNIDSFSYLEVDNDKKSFTSSKKVSDNGTFNNYITSIGYLGTEEEIKKIFSKSNISKLEKEFRQKLLKNIDLTSPNYTNIKFETFSDLDPVIDSDIRTQINKDKKQLYKNLVSDDLIVTTCSRLLRDDNLYLKGQIPEGTNYINGDFVTKYRNISGKVIKSTDVFDDIICLGYNLEGRYIDKYEVKLYKNIFLPPYNSPRTKSIIESYIKGKENIYVSKLIDELITTDLQVKKITKLSKEETIDYMKQHLINFLLNYCRSLHLDSDYNSEINYYKLTNNGLEFTCSTSDEKSPITEHKYSWDEFFIIYFIE